MSKREFIDNGVLEVGNLVSCGHPRRGVEAHAACRLARCDGAASRLGRPPPRLTTSLQSFASTTRITSRTFTATPTRDFQLRLHRNERGTLGECAPAPTGQGATGAVRPEPSGSRRTRVHRLFVSFDRRAAGRLSAAHAQPPYGVYSPRRLPRHFLRLRRRAPRRHTERAGR